MFEGLSLTFMLTSGWSWLELSVVYQTWKSWAQVKITFGISFPAKGGVCEAHEARLSKFRSWYWDLFSDFALKWHHFSFESSCLLTDGHLTDHSLLYLFIFCSFYKFVKYICWLNWPPSIKSTGINIYGKVKQLVSISVLAHLLRA